MIVEHLIQRVNNCTVHTNEMLHGLTNSIDKLVGGEATPLTADRPQVEETPKTLVRALDRLETKLGELQAALDRMSSKEYMPEQSTGRLGR